MIKLISLNIEGDRHLPQIIEFMKREKADVVCLQEVFENSLKKYKEILGMEGVFLPRTKVDQERIWAKRERGEIGTSILSSIKLNKSGYIYYFGNRKEIKTFDISKINETTYGVLVWAALEKEDVEYVVVTTQFTWSPDGEVTDVQREDMRNLLKALDDLGEFVLCGDFNAPRGGEIWNELARRYKDNIPMEIETTIDPNLHRNGALQLVVDGLFSAPKYKISDVRVVCGVSDHQAIVANIMVLDA